MTTDQHYSTTCGTPVGELTLVATDDGLRAVIWGPTGQADSAATINSAAGSVKELPPAAEVADGASHPVLQQTVSQLTEYFDSSRESFDVPLDLRGTAFQLEAWQALGEIPFGTTASYAEQATRIGRPKAVRAVGNANKANPIPIILPCHRVTKTGGDLGGYSGAGGVSTKKSLLEFESARGGT